MTADVPLWVEWVVALLVVASGLASIIAALGLVRLKDFFQRLHPPAISATFGTWTACLASTIYLSFVEGRLALESWLVVIILSITIPITTVFLSRAALFRHRQAGLTDVPPPLSSSASASE